MRQPRLGDWLNELAHEGIVKRLCTTSQSASTVLGQLAQVADALPASGEPLATFAARLFGDAHALDSGCPLATLAVRAAARLGGVLFEDDAEGRRSAWASVCVMCDELSTPALVLNIPAKGPGALSELLRVVARHGEPVHVSLRHLIRNPLSGELALQGRTVFICENPTTIGLAAARFGVRCAPLVCVNGQFATPSLVLLRQLRSAGARLLYHGDFDPGGLVIARRVFAECGAYPWRLGESDYLSAPEGIAFEGRPGPTPGLPGSRPPWLGSDARSMKRRFSRSSRWTCRRREGWPILGSARNEPFMRRNRLDYTGCPARANRSVAGRFCIRERDTSLKEQL
jgi:uncharacterized protein (TIGR02679 family)